MKPISRRNFLRTSALISGTAIGSSLLPKIARSYSPKAEPDIISMPSTNPVSNIARLLEPLGGIQQFVREGQSVGLLLNSPWKHPGYYTNPDFALSMIKLCKEAGAGDIICYKPVRENYWETSRYYEEMQDLLKEVKYADERVEVDIPSGEFLKSAVVYKLYLETDVFINIPVAKHHNGTIYSGVLKGLMGVSSRDTNRYMHSPEGDYTYDKEEYLAGCIADLNLIRQPDLSVVDADICALNNGPRGPGDTTSPGRLLAGTDPLAMDVYSASLIGMEPADILTFQKAKNHKLGKYSLDDIAVEELG